MTRRLALLSLLCLWVCSYPTLAEDTSAPQPITYELKFARYADTFDKKTEYVFIIGEIAYRSVDDLKKGISHFTKGSILRWAPGCRRSGDEPLLSSEKEMQAFKTYCESLGIKFILIPSG